MKTRQRTNRGFTLLELFVSLVLIGIIVSVAVWSIGDGGQARKIHEEAKRFHLLLQLAQEEAILNNRELVLNITPAGYRFSVLINNKLEAMQGDVFRERTFEDFIKPELKFDEQAIQLLQDKDDTEQDINIYILSSGELTPFTIRFPADDKSYLVKSSLEGELTFSIEDSLT